MIHPFSFIKGDAGPFDPADLALEGWWQAAYAGGPWEGTASAGGSGSQDLDATNDPSVGLSVNGYATASFNGTNDHLDGANCSTFMTTTNFSGWALLNVSTIANNDASVTNQDNIVTTSGTGRWGIGLSDNGAGTVNTTLRIYTGVNRTVSTSFVTAAWQLVQWRADGSTIEIRVNDGSWASATGGTIDSLAFALRVGQNAGDSQWLAALMLDIGLSKVKFSDDTFDNILDYCRARYDLDLT
jgi:hypothetical protein